MHPSSVLLLAAGETATLECSSSGEPAPSITWQVDGVDIDTDAEKVLILMLN